jgi:hypothetical protein
LFTIYPEKDSLTIDTENEVLFSLFYSLFITLDRKTFKNKTKCQKNDKIFMSSKFSSLYQKILKGKDKVSIGPQ